MVKRLLKMRRRFLDGQSNQIVCLRPRYAGDRVAIPVMSYFYVYGASVMRVYAPSHIACI